MKCNNGQGHCVKLKVVNSPRSVDKIQLLLHIWGPVSARARKRISLVLGLVDKITMTYLAKLSIHIPVYTK